MDGNSHILSGSNLKVDGIRHGFTLCRHRHTSLTIEGQTDSRGLVNLRTTTGGFGQCQFYALNLRSTRTELISQFQTHFLSPD